jgi:nucleoside-diphosphate-sugar epimerase
MSHDNVLITGASGRLGEFVLDEFSDRGSVSVLDLQPPHRADVPYVRGDVTDLDTVRAAVSGHDAVVHLAAIDLGVPATPERYFGVNVMGTWNVLQAAQEAGIRKVILASSISASGVGEMRDDFVPDYLPVDEMHRCEPVHPYGISKRVVEEVAQGFARTGMSVICMRPTAVAVPSHLPKMIPRTLDRDHRWLASYVTGADTARAFRLALDYDAAYDVFFLSAADSATAEPTLQRAERLFGRLPELRAPSRFAGDSRASMIDSNRARERLGWEPTSSWPELAATVDGDAEETS